MPPILSAAVLSEVIDGIYHRHGISNDELARLARVSASTMSRIRSEEMALRSDVLQTLSVALCDTHGITDLAEALLSTEFVVCRRGEARANGDLADESKRLFLAFGRALDAFEAGDPATGRAALADARTALDEAHAEMDALASPGTGRTS